MNYYEIVTYYFQKFLLVWKKIFLEKMENEINILKVLKFKCTFV